MTKPRLAALAFVFLFFFIGGIGHFVATDFFASIVPPWLPMSPRTAVYVSGVFELLGAAGLLSKRTRSLAGWGLLLLTVCVTPANVHMWLHKELYPGVPEAALIARLVLQLLLIGCIWWSTRPPAPGR